MGYVSTAQPEGGVSVQDAGLDHADILRLEEAGVGLPSYYEAHPRGGFASSSEIERAGLNGTISTSAPGLREADPATGNASPGQGESLDELAKPERLVQSERVPHRYRRFLTGARLMRFSRLKRTKTTRTERARFVCCSRVRFSATDGEQALKDETGRLGLSWTYRMGNACPGLSICFVGGMWQE